ncbi:hypothetical protein [Qaidamihabitans albus]|uniref:hypothetical protein n=1 Tax=Qaidamihabitans albus TaxID=2795733 RepID=UPI0018F15C1C|nr:hypothetical protein [Qaidamihabitans albus]
MSSPPRPAPDRPAGAVPDGARGDGELARRLVAGARLRQPRTQLILAALAGLMLVTCLVATLTRLSPWPLLPLLPLVPAGYALRRVRIADRDRPLLGWTVLLAGGLALSLWLMSIVGRMFE